MLTCQDCGVDTRKLTKCTLCGMSVCDWCIGHVYNNKRALCHKASEGPVAPKATKLKVVKNVPPCKPGMPAHIFTLGGDKCSVCGWARHPPLKIAPAHDDSALQVSAPIPLPCPFCGVVPFITKYADNRSVVECYDMNCPVKPRVCRDHLSNTVVAWNTRIKP